MSTPKNEELDPREDLHADMMATIKEAGLELGDIEVDTKPEEGDALGDEADGAKAGPDDKGDEANPAGKDGEKAEPDEDFKGFAEFDDAGRAALTSASPEVRAAVKSALTAMQGDRDVGREIGQMFAPYTDELSKHGLSPSHVIKEWIGLHQFSQRDPVGYIKHFMAALKIDAAALADKPKPEEKTDEDDDIFTDPEVKRLRAEVEALKASRQPPAGKQEETAEQAAIEQHRMNVLKQINAFAEEKDEGGAHRNPYFAVLQPAMTKLAHEWRQQGRALFSLRDLYDAAAQADPKIRALLEADTKKAAEEADRKRKHDALARSRRASSSVRSDAEATDKAPNFEDLPLREQLMANARAAGMPGI